MTMTTPLFDIFATPLITVLIMVFAVLFGLFFGSFLNCVGIRIARGENFVKGRSHCMKCGHDLAAKDLVPVFSWLFLKGKCRYCGEKISGRYPAAEIIMALVFVSILLRFNLSLRGIELLVLSCIVMTAACSDLEDFIIPDRCIIAGIVLRIIFVVIEGILTGNWWPSEEGLGVVLNTLIGGASIAVPLLIVVLIMEKVLKRDAMGGGDIKLVFMLGLFFLWSENIIGILCSCIIGIVFGILARKKGKVFQFGPSIAAGWWIAALAGSIIVDWYMGLMKV